MGIWAGIQPNRSGRRSSRRESGRSSLRAGARGLRSSRRDLVDAGQEVGGDFGCVEGVERIVELRDRASSDKGRGHSPLLEGPTQGEMVKRHAGLSGNGVQGVQFVVLLCDLVGLEESFFPSGSGSLRNPGEVFARKHALGERAENDGADTLVVKPFVNSLGFRPSIEDGIGGLIDQATHAHVLEDRDGALESFEWVFGKSNVERFALLHGGGKGGHGFLQGRFGVRPMRVEDVDVIESQSAQGLVERRQEVLA